VLPPGELTRIKLEIVRAQKLHIFWFLIIFFARLLLDY